MVLVELIALGPMKPGEERDFGIKRWLKGPKQKSVRTRQEDVGVIVGRERIAILPFANISPDPQDEYFADGMTEELISTLSKIGTLRVISRTSVMRYKHTDKSVDEISKELNVGSILEGSVRKAANDLRITVKLIDVQKDEHIWSQNYERRMENVFAVQSEIAERVAESLKVKLLDSDRQKLVRSPTGSAEAHTLYLKGRHHIGLLTKEGTDIALEYFKLALERDPGFALGYSGLAECLMQLEKPDYLGSEEYAKKALHIDPGLAEAHRTLADVLAYYSHQLEAAEAEYRKAIELNPNYARAHNSYAVFLRHLGRVDESFSEFRKALELDPLSRRINVSFGWGLFWRGELDKAIGQFKKVIEIFPNFPAGYWGLGCTYLRRSMYDEAFATAETYFAMSNNTFGRLYLRAYVHASKGEPIETQKILNEMLEHSGEERFSPFLMGLVYLRLGERDAGFEWVNRACTENDDNIWALIDVFNAFDELADVRTDPRFLSLLEKIGLTKTREQRESPKMRH